MRIKNKQTKNKQTNKQTNKKITLAETKRQQKNISLI